MKIHKNRKLKSPVVTCPRGNHCKHLQVQLYFLVSFCPVFSFPNSTNTLFWQGIWEFPRFAPPPSFAPLRLFSPLASPGACLSQKVFTHSRLPLDGAGGEAYSEASIKKTKLSWVNVYHLLWNYSSEILYQWPPTLSYDSHLGRECAREKLCPVSSATHVTSLMSGFPSLVNSGGNCCLMSLKGLS